MASCASFSYKSHGSTLKVSFQPMNVTPSVKPDQFLAWKYAVNMGSVTVASTVVLYRKGTAVGFLETAVCSLTWRPTGRSSGRRCPISSASDAQKESQLFRSISILVAARMISTSENVSRGWAALLPAARRLNRGPRL